MQTTNENISPSVINRLVKELKESQKSPLEGIDVVINEENITDVQADVEGPGIPTITVQSLFATRLGYCTERSHVHSNAAPRTQL